MLRKHPTLAAYLRERHQLSWNQARTLCQRGKVLVDGKVCTDATLRIRPEQVIEIHKEAPRVRQGVLDASRVLYFDNDLIVVNKPPGIMSVPFDGEKDTLVDLTRAWINRNGSRVRKQNASLGVVQRLDKDTTGVMVFTRTMTAKHALQNYFRQHTIEREYLALVHGNPKSGKHESWLIPNRGDGIRGSWKRNPKHNTKAPTNSQHAITFVKVERQFSGAALIRCRLFTGRQHQIRIHLSEAGCPLIGERVYIRDYDAPRIPAQRPMLHAASLGFLHPRTHEPMLWKSDPPEDFQQQLQMLMKG